MIMLQTVPFVGLFSAMATLVSLNRRYELVIARSAGISAWQFLLPCLHRRLAVRRPVGRRSSTRSPRTASPRPSRSKPSCAPANRTRFRPSPRPGSARRPAPATPSSARAPSSTRAWNWPTPSFFVLDPQRRHRRAQGRQARPICATAIGNCRTSRLFRDGDAVEHRGQRSRADQSEAGIRAGAAGAPGNHPVLRASRQDRGCPLLRPQGKCLCHAVPFADGAAVPARRHDADCGNSFDAICEDGAVGNDDSGWRRCRVSALCRFGAGQGIRQWRDSCRPSLRLGFRSS